MQELIYNDNTQMPYGKYKGKTLSNVPADYLIWLYDTSEQGNRMYDRKLAKYIQDNLQGLKLEIEQIKQRKRYERR